jgi:hypothetical protein
MACFLSARNKGVLQIMGRGIVRFRMTQGEKSTQFVVAIPECPMTGNRMRLRACFVRLRLSLICYQSELLGYGVHGCSKGTICRQSNQQMT